MRLQKLLQWNLYVFKKHRKISNTTPIPDIDKQHQWYLEYRVDAVQLGQMCEDFPGLQKSWEQFKMMYELCRSQNVAHRQIT